MKVFVDTGPLIAILVKTDIWHKKCLEKYSRYKKEDSLFLQIYLYFLNSTPEFFTTTAPVLLNSQ